SSLLPKQTRSSAEKRLPSHHRFGGQGSDGATRWPRTFRAEWTTAGTNSEIQRRSTTPVIQYPDCRFGRTIGCRWSFPTRAKARVLVAPKERRFRSHVALHEECESLHGNYRESAESKTAQFLLRGAQFEPDDNKPRCRSRQLREQLHQKSSSEPVPGFR